jgi:Xaa-Pro aminopeptidase
MGAKMLNAGYQMDLLGQGIVDFEERVNIPRLKKERLERLQAQMAKDDLGGLLLFDPLNIRYATGRRSPGILMMRGFFSYVLVPREGAPFFPEEHYNSTSLELEEGFTESRSGGQKGITWEFLGCGGNVQEAARLWGQRLKDHMNDLGIAGQRLGVDRLDYYAIEALKAQDVTIADGRIPSQRARAVKTIDEISLIRQACAIADVAITRTRDAIRPGVTENKLFSILTATNIEFGGEHMDARMLSAGGNTNPWSAKTHSDRIVRLGDLVAYDTDMAGPMGYYADISRTYLCGDGRPTEEQLEAYKLAYNFIYESMDLFRAGINFQEIAEKCPPIPEEYKSQRYGCIAHGDGMCNEWPSIFWPDHSWSGFGSDSDVLVENMVMSIEGLGSKVGARESVKLEEQVLITARGPELLSTAPFDERFLT